MSAISELHQPVLLERTIDLFRSVFADPAICVDCTLGLGGHTEALLEQFEQLRVIGLDRDPEAICLATERLARFGDRFQAVNANYDELEEVLSGLGIEAVDGVLMDLGVSSMQLDQPERGFSYAQDAPLDMRMNPEVGESAAELLATLDADELTRIFREFGEERYAASIAKRIVASNPRPTTSAELNAIVELSVPRVPGKTTGHPAKRVYQALRIAVNGELSSLRRAVPQALAALRPGGRIVVMSYHSLEDEIVKGEFDRASRSSSPIELPVELPGTEATFKILTRGVERAGEVELAKNPRAAAARLRAAEKLER